MLSIFSYFQACLSVAYMSPTYQGLVYGEPVEVSVNVMEGAGWGPKTESENRTVVKVYGAQKMTWQAEYSIGFFLKEMMT